MKKVWIIILVLTTCCFIFNNVSATGFLDEIFTDGTNFENAGHDSGLGSSLAGFIKGDIKKIIELIGNLIFAGVTVILGAKYIWSGFDGKSQVKETLPTFVAAVLFFYLAVEITDLFSPKTAGSIGATIGGASNYNNIASTIIGTINTIVKYLAFGGIVFIGLRYMFESAEGKAQIKDKLVPMVLGIILVFLASTFVDFIITAGQEIIS